ncbi:Protein of unknown function (DUF501), putative [Trypanosoma equiperdum]|uniref:Uncharacterized protein n=2 Tax=Trypanozoon TaxID=39700 RepID=Q580D1_TRYB2|nr:hypothetical protein, conserved [Trypanosoma brucei brucei TREU927]AAX80904.1 hypothetical protein, conserved [Trypanosoma brucei]AAZ10694.1 hypothetical protein, conserved [Trypanosoma brucei brucei TREU927]SCU71097.1 Protein of unknown function (DUF501), putative [Trypanosoma equiperdum]
MQSPSAFVAAADQSNYRVPDAQLATCTKHGGAAVLCATAGKVGRNGRTAAVGATLFWLTCPYLNTIVARFERHSAISALQRLLDNDRKVSEAHVASHARYEERAKELLSSERWAFFDAHFVTGAAESAGGRKYGNAAVSHATDLKCLHALVAQSLCGASNPIGDAVIHYILLLAEKVKTIKNASAPLSSEKGSSGDCSTAEVCGGENSFAAESLALDEVSLLVEFVKQRLTDDIRGDRSDLRSVHDADKLCSSACEVLTFLDGRPPRSRKKHRIN